MIEILQTLATVSIVAFAVLSILSGVIFLLALDKEKVEAEKRVIVTFFFNYWSKKNVLASCKPNWVRLVLTMRLLIFISLFAICSLAVIASFR